MTIIQVRCICCGNEEFVATEFPERFLCKPCMELHRVNEGKEWEIEFEESLEAGK